MKPRASLAIALWALCLLICPLARASDPVMIQYFEAEWETMRYRMPDVFMAGYDGAWLPPPQRAAAGTNGIGYDLFDRFDLGSELDPTRYGSESGFRLLVDEFHKAGCHVFVDWLMNHNAAWDNSSGGDPFLNNGLGFLQNGGYPGFALELPSDQWGDFHPPGPQSTNPGEPNYDLYNGRLLGLIDIDQAQAGQGYEFIRHPVEPNPANLPMPPTAMRNQPDAGNYRLYPDRDLPGYTPVNPGTNRNPAPPSHTFYQYNTAQPAEGDPAVESAAFLLLRSTQYYLEVLGVDGFRLDAAKHIPTWFWDNMWDAAVHNRYVAFDGSPRTPYSFVEAIESNANIANWVRKPGENGGPGYPSIGWEFGNRDALDINEAGQLRDLVNADGAKSWDDVMGASVDNVDGYNNGTIGVHHVNSHDNTIPADEDDTVAQAYVLTRTGPCVVYHNALQFGPVSFPKPNGRDDALGLGSERIARLVNIRNQYGRGWFMPRNGDRSDVLVFTRQTPGSGGVDNLLVAVNDRESNGFDTLSVPTAFPLGTRMHELTGNAADPTVDPTGDIPELLIVGGGGWISGLRVPRNSNNVHGFHGRGYVLYGPAVPTGTLSIANATTATAPPDTAGTPDYRQRVNEVTIITSPTFEIALQAQQTDPLDPNTDDQAVFRIDQGFVDYNGNGVVDRLDPSAPDYGFEDFLTANSPLFSGGSGDYRQIIDAATLGEGYHYITVRCFRHRPAGADPLFGEFRMVVYVDLGAPDLELISPTANCDEDITALPVEFVVQAADTTVDRVHIFVDLPYWTDFITLAQSGGGRAERFVDRFSLTRGALLSGNHRVDVIGFETLPNGLTRSTHRTYTGIQSTTGVGLGNGDVNHNGVVDLNDIYPFVLYLSGTIPIFEPAADLNCDGLLDGRDVAGFVDVLLQ